MTEETCPICNNRLRKYSCPVCGIELNQLQNRSLIHDHYVHEIALLLRQKGFTVHLEYPLTVKEFSEKWKKIPRFKEGEQEVSETWHHVDIFAEQKNEKILLEVEGSNDTFRQIGLKVAKMNAYDKSARTIIFSMEKYQDLVWWKKYKKNFQKVYPECNNYAELYKKLYLDDFKRYDLNCEYWNEDTLKKEEKNSCRFHFLKRVCLE